MSPMKNEPSHQSILDAISENRLAVESWQRGHSERMGLVELELHTTNARFDDHVKREDDGLLAIRSMLERHITDSAAWRTKNDSEMAENTAITKEYAQGRNFVRVGTALIKWAGVVVLALGSIWWGVKEMLHHTNITPGP